MQRFRPTRDFSFAGVFTACLGLLGCGACSSAPGADLLSLSDVSPVEDGERGVFAVHGEGFPVGREGEVELGGVVRQPGRPPRPVHVSLPAQAIAADQLRFTTHGERTLRALSPGQFLGELSVTFRSGPALVQGHLATVSLALRAESVAARRDALTAALAASEWLASLGASELETRGEGKGVRVAVVQPASAAFLAGLRAGDRIVEIEDVPISDVAELWPTAGPGQVRLRVTRGSGKPARLLHLPRPEGRRTRAEPSLPWLSGLCLLWLGLVVLRPAPLEAPPRRPLPRWTDLALGALVALLALAAMWGGDQVHVVRGPALCVCALLVVLGLGAAGQRLDRWAFAVERIALAAWVLAAAGLSRGTLTPELGQPLDGPRPDWPLLLLPPGWLALALCYASLRAPSASGRLRAVLGATRLSMVAALSALWGGLELSLFGAPHSLSAFALTSVALWLLLEVGLPPQPASPWLRGALALGCAGASLAWMLWTPPAAVIATLAPLAPCLLAGIALRRGVLALRRRFAPPPRLDPALAPFL